MNRLAQTTNDSARPLLENRIPPPIVTLIVAIAMWAVSLLSSTDIINGSARYALIVIFFVLGGVCGFPAVQSFIRVKTTIDPVHVERASVLVTTGIYRLTRNPMYVAMTFLLLSWAAYLATPWSFLGPLFFVLFITRFQIMPEERAMAANFGAAYLDYKGRVRRWL